MRRRALLGAVLVSGLAACVAEDLGGSFLIVNEWDRVLRLVCIGEGQQRQDR